MKETNNLLPFDVICDAASGDSKPLFKMWQLKSALRVVVAGSNSLIRQGCCIWENKKMKCVRFVRLGEFIMLN